MFCLFYLFYACFILDCSAHSNAVVGGNSPQRRLPHPIEKRRRRRRRPRPEVAQKKSEREPLVKMAEKSSTDRTEDDNMDKNVAPGASMMMVTVKTPNGKEEISILEGSSVSQVG